MHFFRAAGLLAAIAISASAQSTPSHLFRLVTPKGPGSLEIDTNRWTVERFALYDHGTRAILQLQDKGGGIVASYILWNDATFDFDKESCKNDVLGPLMQGVLKNATIRNKQNGMRRIPTGHTLDIGSYLIAKNEGVEVNQQNVFGFMAKGHACAEIHLSRMPFKAGEESLFDASLDAFRFDPSYMPSTSDYKAMAALLPPEMASQYIVAPSPLKGGEKDVSGQSLTLALATHPGSVHMDAPNFVITELSAKPNGNEFGLRARDNDISGAEALAFLFIPQPEQPTAVACRDWMLRSEQPQTASSRNILKKYEALSDSQVPVALVEYEQPKAPQARRFVRRFFAASNDLCLDVALTTSGVVPADTAKDLFKTLTFDPKRPPDFFDTFRYASVVFDHKEYAAAAPIYVSALALVDFVPDSKKWRRVATDQASMAYGIAGDLERSRELNETAIAKDPDYPLYYYNLACADAESGNATSARTHLQQAFDRRANTLPGEHLPDPRTDDSILKLKQDKAFWSFVQALPKS